MVVSKVLGSGADLKMIASAKRAHRVPVYVNSTQWHRGSASVESSQRPLPVALFRTSSSARSALRINVHFSFTEIGVKLEDTCDTLARVVQWFYE